MKANVLFRPSEISKIMTKPRVKKSNRDRYDELHQMLDKCTEEFSELKNKSTKKADSLAERINRYIGEIEALEPLKDLPLLSDTAKKLMRSKMIEIKYSRYEDIETKYMKKGKLVEEDSITLYSLYHGKVFKNNKERVQNDYFSGEIDLPWQDNFGKVYAISDIKSSWSIFTFFENEEKIKKENEDQGHCYLDLYPDAQEYYIANCLIDSPDDILLDELYRESFKWAEQDVPAWRELQIIRNHKYDADEFKRFVEMRGHSTAHKTCEKAAKIISSFKALEINERVIEHTFPRNEERIAEIKAECDKCRKYLEIMYGIKHEPDVKS